jgi:AcrR family transcriptional regulator
MERTRDVGRLIGRPSTARLKRIASGRERILSVTRDLIAEQGFKTVSAREIARRARVNPALLYHYFADKEELLLRALELSFEVLPVEKGPSGFGTSGLGERIVRRFLRTWGVPAKSPLIHTMLRAACEDPRAARQFREHIETEIFPATRAQLGPSAARPASLVGSMLLGVGVMRYILCVEPLASMSDRDVERWVGSQIEDTITRGGNRP